MRTMVVVTLSLTAATLLAAESSPPPPFKLPPLFEGWSAKDFRMFDDAADSPARVQRAVEFRARGTHCYFIRQANRNLTKPSDKPRLIPLASDASDNVYAPDPACLPATIIRKAVLE